MLVWLVATGTHAASSIVLPDVSPSWSQCALHCSSTAMDAVATSFLRSPGYFHILRVTLKWLGAGA